MRLRNPLRLQQKENSSSMTRSNHQENRPLTVEIFTRGLALLLGLVGIGGILFGFYLFINPAIVEIDPNSLFQLNQTHYGISLILIGGVVVIVARGFWRYFNWARMVILTGLLLFILFYFVTIIFSILSTIFAGLVVVPLGSILRVVGLGLFYFFLYTALPILLVVILRLIEQYFIESTSQRDFIEKLVRTVLLGAALSSIIVVILIFLFTMTEAWDSVQTIGLDTMLLGTVWRPGSIIGTDTAQYGLVPMVVGTILSTIGAVIIGVPLSIGTAILLAEVAPRAVREVLRSGVELLAGIPSVVYGLFGMVVLAPLIRNIDVPRNTGFGLLNASIVLAVMIIPTVTSIAEDAIRAVPREYKEGSLALGGTHWQTITRTILPAARSGILAAIILGVGRALGETMAMIMVIGNSIAIPRPLTGNPLTLFLNTARTLTGNIAVEINYAAGAHRSALFFTGVLLFLMILVVNSTARFMLHRKDEEA